MKTQQQLQERLNALLPQIKKDLLDRLNTCNIEIVTAEVAKLNSGGFNVYLETGDIKDSHLGYMGQWGIYEYFTLHTWFGTIRDDGTFTIVWQLNFQYATGGRNGSELPNARFTYQL